MHLVIGREDNTYTVNGIAANSVDGLLLDIVMVIEDKIYHGATNVWADVDLSGIGQQHVVGYAEQLAITDVITYTEMVEIAEAWMGLANAAEHKIRAALNTDQDLDYTSDEWLAEFAVMYAVMHMSKLARDRRAFFETFVSVDDDGYCNHTTRLTQNVFHAGMLSKEHAKKWHDATRYADPTLLGKLSRHIWIQAAARYNALR